MTGEMSREEVTRENYPLHFAAADTVEGATVQPFDQYQGPYILVPGRGRYWLTSELDRAWYWWSETDDETSDPFLGDLYVSEDWDEHEGVSAFVDLVNNGGRPVER